MRHIVVVDDDEITAYAYARYLKHSGNHVTAAHQTKDALRIAEKIKIDVLVTDFRLDSMNGIELVKAMRQLQPGLPSIIVSGYTEDFGVEGEQIEVLRKPVSLELLVKTIADLVAG